MSTVEEDVGVVISRSSFKGKLVITQSYLLELFLSTISPNNHSINSDSYCLSLKLWKLF